MRRRTRSKAAKVAAKEARLGAGAMILAAALRSGSGSHGKKGYVRHPKHQGRGEE